MNTKITLQELLDKTDSSHIWFSSDWHLFKNHYKKEKNLVNTREIISYCRKTFGPKDIFIYLGDMTFRYANDEDNQKAREIFYSIPGIKVLILGNHDVVLGEDFYSDCGFQYVYEKFEWDKYVFTHRPINMELYPDGYWNIHGHTHDVTRYNNSDGSRNINVYPANYGNKPVTLYYLLRHKEKLVKNNVHNDNNGLLGESAVNESMLINKKDLCLNTDKFDSGKSNILLITGLSGSGKSTLANKIAKEYHAEYIELDLFENISMFQNDGQVKEAGEVFYEYLSTRPKLWDQLKKKELRGSEFGKECSKFINYVISYCKRHKDQVFVIEGVQIYEYCYSGNLNIKGLPLIIIRTSALTSMIRRIKRNYKNGELKNWNDVKNLELVKCLAYYMEEEKVKKFFEKEIQEEVRTETFTEDPAYEIKLEACKSDDALEVVLGLEMLSEFTINDLMYYKYAHKAESVSAILELKRSEIPDKDFGIPELRKYPLDTEEHVRSAIKFFNYADPKYEKKLALKIKRKMKEYKITDIHIGEKNRLSKYITEFCIETCDYLIRELSAKHEFSMASVNPVIGITRPYVMVANTIPTKQYIFSPNLISSKYLVIDENCKLQLIDRSYVENIQVDVYNFIGDINNVKKLYESYNKGESVNIYECLTGRKLLSDDQIEYDSDFRKIKADNLYQIEGFQNNLLEFSQYLQGDVK